MINVRVDVTNPGQFFACCGLFELAHRLSPGCRAAFTEDGQFRIKCTDGATALLLEDVVTAFHDAGLVAIDPDNATKSPLSVPHPFNLRLDWWNDDRTGGSDQRTWAGQQKVVEIATAVHAALMDQVVDGDRLFFQDAILCRGGGRSEPIEAFYFDSRRGAQGTALDLGFSPDKQKLRATVIAALELLCLVGLQRFRPRTSEKGLKHFRVWRHPLPIVAASAVAACAADITNASTYTFRLLRRSDSNAYYLGFSTAVSQGDRT